MNWLLIIVLLILVVNALIGLKVGFIKTVFSLCSMILALLLTTWISPTVNDFLRNNDKFYNYVQEKVEKVLPLGEEEVQSSEEVSAIEKLPLPQSIRDALIANRDNDLVKDALSIDSFKAYVSSYLTGIIINALAFILTFAVILIALWALCLALNIISKLPLLNQINKTTGLIAGLLHGLVVIWLFFILLTVFQSSELGQKAMVMIGESQILSIIYNNNFILSFITSATKMFL